MFGTAEQSAGFALESGGSSAQLLHDAKEHIKNNIIRPAALRKPLTVVGTAGRQISAPQFDNYRRLPT
jgi:hypothetical protein